MKLLERILSSALLAAALSCGSEAPAPVYSGQAQSTPCRADTDCKQDRVCTEGYCKDGTGMPGDGNTQGLCGNSPLVGKYLWVLSCNAGTETPLGEDCTGILKVCDECGNDIYHFTYDNLTLQSVGRDGREGTELKRSFTKADLGDDHECGIGNQNVFDKYQCALSMRSNMYVQITAEGKVCLEPDTIYLVQDAPWLGKDQCRRQLQPLRTSLSERCHLE